MENVRRYCTYNTLPYAGMGLKFICNRKWEVLWKTWRVRNGIDAASERVKTVAITCNLANGATCRRCRCCCNYLYSERECLSVLRKSTSSWTFLRGSPSQGIPSDLGNTKINYRPNIIHIPCIKNIIHIIFYCVITKCALSYKLRLELSIVRTSIYKGILFVVMQNT